MLRRRTRKLMHDIRRGLLLMGSGAVEAAILRWLLRWLPVFRVALVLATFGLALVVSDGTHLRPAFFEAAAQIIPVLLLALALEGRLLTPAADRRQGSDLLSVLVLLLMFALGERIALGAVGSGKATAEEGQIVIAVIVAGTTGIGVTALTHDTPSLRELGRDPARGVGRSLDRVRNRVLVWALRVKHRRAFFGVGVGGAGSSVACKAAPALCLLTSTSASR